MNREKILKLSRDMWNTAMHDAERRLQSKPSIVEFSADVANAYHAEKTKLRPIDDWHEDMNDVLCWTVPVSEAPVISSPICSDYPESTTHFTELLMPSNLDSDGFDIEV